MPVAMTEAIPIMESNGTTGRNSARDIRTQLFSALWSPDSTGYGVRPGVIPRQWINVSGFEFVDLKVIQLDTPGQAVKLFPGKCAVVRTGQGPYVLSQETTVTNYPLDAADTGNPRIDVVYARLYDHAIGDSGGGPHGPYIEHVNGSPSGSPVVPSVPTGALPLAQILRAANNNTVVAANITDLRKSTQLQGTPRVLLPGDSVADAGIVPGEERLRVATTAQIAAGTPPFIRDVWCADGKWRPATYDIVGRNRRSTNVTTVATTAAGAFRIFTARAPVIAGRTYRIYGRGALSHSSAGVTAQVNFHFTTNDAEPTTSSSIMFRMIEPIVASGVPYPIDWSCTYDATADGFLRVTPAMFTASGTGTTLTWEAATGPNPAELIIEDKGPTVAIAGAIY